MQQLNLYLYKSCQFYVNHAIPHDAVLLRKLYKENGEQSQVAGWDKIHTSILLPRLLKGPLIAPLALADSGSYALRGVLKAGIEVLDGNLNNAIYALTNGLLSALQYLAVAVASVAYAAIGLVVGSAFYSLFIPQPLEKEIPETERVIAALQEKIKSLEDHAKQPPEDKKVENRRIADLEGQLKGMQALQKNLEDYRAKLKELEAANKKNQDDFIEVIRGKQQLREQLQNQKNDVNQLKLQLEQREKQFKSDVEERQLVINQSADLKNTIKNLQDQIAENDKLGNQRIAGLENQLEKHKAEFKALEAVNQEKQVAFNEAKKQNERLRAQLQKQTAEVDQVKLQLEQNAKQSKKDAEDYQYAMNKYSESKQLRAHIIEKYIELFQENARLKNPENPELQITLNASMTGSLIPLRPSTAETKPAEMPVVNQTSKNYFANAMFGFVNTANTWVVQPTLNRIILPLISKGRQFVWDAKDPWKNHRYEEVLKQTQKLFGEEEIKALQSLENLPNASPQAKEVLQKLKSALSALTCPELFSDVRTQKKAFLVPLREALRILQNEPDHGVPQDLADRINALCRKWMTEIEMNPFFYKLVLYVASGQRKNDPTRDNKQILELVNDLEAPLRDKLEGLLKGIEGADQNYKAPTGHLLAAKLEVINDSYDTLLKDNMPSKIATMVYQDSKGNQRTVQEYRTGVPIGLGPDGVAVVPEIKAFLNDLKAQNATKKEGEPKDKLLMVLHLNPKHYNTDADELNKLTPKQLEEEKSWLQALLDGVTHIPDDLDLKQKEALWIKLIRHLSLDPNYKDVLSVALIPMDGDWLKKDIEHCNENKTLTQLHNHLLGVITQKNSPYIIPNMTPDKKKEFISNILKDTTAQYFASFIGDQRTLNKEQMLAFIGIFNGHLVEALQIKEKATYVQRNCKDAVDRTMALVGVELFDRYLRLDKLYVQENLEKIFGAICGPALSIVKRELLKERQPILLAAASYFDVLKRDGVKTGPAPTFEGYRLTDIQMGEDQDQTLYPTPSEAKKNTDYMDLIQFEKDHPFAVSHKFKMDLSTETLEAMKNPSNFDKLVADMTESFLGFLKQRYDHPELHYQVTDKSGETEGSQKDDIFSVQKSFVIHQADGGKDVVLLKGKVAINLSDGNVQFTYDIAK
jgi:hypothetical protein